MGSFVFLTASPVDLFVQLNRSFDSSCIEAIAAPLPVFRFFNQTTPDRIAMDIAQLLNVLLPAVNIEIMKARLPECGGAFVTPSAAKLRTELQATTIDKASRSVFGTKFIETRR